MEVSWKLLLLVIIGILVGATMQTQESDDKDEEEASIETEEEDSVIDKSMYIKFADDTESGDRETFIPTSEWQVVKPGQSIPKGLHIRYDLQTGVYMAKLLEDGDEPMVQGEEEKDKSVEMSSKTSVLPLAEKDESNDSHLKSMKNSIEQAMKELEEDSQQRHQEGIKYWKEGDQEGMMNLNKETFSKKELKEALQKFKANRDDVQNSKIKEESLKQTFRSYDELKEDFAKINMGVKTDNEILQRLIKEYIEPKITTEHKLDILTDMEYYVHQIDNAVDFSKMGGLELVIQDLNNSKDAIRSEAALVLGSATQSNPPVQIMAIEGGALQQLIRMLSTDPSISVRNRVLYATSSMLRHFPFAQLKFLKLGGLAGLAQLFSQSGTEKLRVKAITLVNDIIIEQEFALKNSNPSSSEEQEKLKQYKQIPMQHFIREQGWCRLVPTLLASPEHDSREKVITAMHTFMATCKQDFTDTNIVSTLVTLKTEYEHLSNEEAEEENDDQYFSGMLQNINSVMTQIKTRDEL